MAVVDLFIVAAGTQGSGILNSLKHWMLGREFKAQAMGMAVREPESVEDQIASDAPVLPPMFVAKPLHPPRAARAESPAYFRFRGGM